MSTINVLGPVGFNPTGPYDATRTYQKLDVVYYQGSSYVAISDSLGQLPTNADYWLCIAAGSLKQFTYDTVADMKADNTLSEGMYANTVGYYEANDGGAAIYKITLEESQSEYQEELENGLYATLITKESINIKQIGYIDTMTASEQTTFLNDVFSKFDNILIKDENITINDNLLVKSNQNIKMFNSSIHNTTTTNQKYIFALRNIENVNITGLNSELYFDKPSTPQQACLQISNSKNIYFEGISLKSAGGEGIIVSGENNETISSNINIKNCLIDNNRRNGVALIGGVKGFYISNCTITNTSGTDPQFAIDLETWQNEIYNEDVIIDNCILKDNIGGIDIMPYNKNIQIKNCKLYNGVNSVIKQSKGENAYPKNVIIENNEFHTPLYLRGTQYGEYKIINNTFISTRILTEGEEDITNFYKTGPKKGYLHIINNSIINSNSTGISVSYGSNVIISDNYIEKPRLKGIEILGSNNVKIINNTIKDYAQSDDNKTNIWGIYIATTYNTLIDGNIFFNSQEVTFVRVISIQALCQRLITVNNIALDLQYSAFLGKDGTVTKEVYANNLTNN